jgi:uncharacterized protein (DUF58 family)
MAQRQAFNRAWIELAILLIPLALLLDIRAFLIISAALLTIVMLTWWWNRRSLEGVAYERLLGERRAFPGEVVEMTLRVTNGKLLPLAWLLVEDQWSMALPLEDGLLFPPAYGQMGIFRTAFALRWFERVNRRYHFRCTRRGFYPFGPARLRSGDIWGLFRQDCILDRLDWLIVYPQVLPLEALGFPAKDPLGEIKAAWRIFEDPSRAVGIRDHQPEDSFRRIHWKATARRQDLQVKVYEPTTSHSLVIFLNVATFARHWEGTRPWLLERVIAVAASIASHAVQDRFVVGLLANGSIPHSDQPIKVLPSRRPDQLARLLEALAAVTSFTTSSLEGLLLAESPRLPWGATLVVVTGLVTEDLLSALARLRDVGRRLALVSLEDEPSLPYTLPPGVPGSPAQSRSVGWALHVYHLPASQLPFDDTLLGEGGPAAPEWAPEVAPPLRFAGESP